MIKSKKAVNEIISTIIIMLIMVIVVGIIITGVSSQLSKSKEKLNYDNSIKVRDLVFSAIMETYNSPIEATKEINFSLSNLELVVDSDTETIEVCFVGKNLKFFADGKRLEEDNNKYSYRVLQKVCSGVAFENIDLIRSITLNNKEQARLVFKKITENKISVSVDNETSASWYTQKNEYIYDENAGNWKYRKKILINSGNVLGNLNNVPVTITLTDEDLKNFANNDGSDLLFTLSDGVTKLKKKITDYDHETGELTVLLTIPSFNVGKDVNVYTYEEKTRKKITINHAKVDGDLVDFPVLISIRDENLVSLAKEDGSDIYFTLSDGTTRLKREIESFTDINLFRKKITIDHIKVDEDLVDFPVLISITDSDLATYAKEDGSDIYFAIDNGHPKLKREIEDYNSETGTLVAWVKIPSLSSTADTNFYIYFGDKTESNSNDTDVWDVNYATVMHFTENVKTNDTNAFFDSTINNMTGQLKNFSFDENSNTGVSGKIGNSVLLDGINDYIQIKQPTIGGYITYSHWINKNFTNQRRATRTGKGNISSNYIVIYNGNNFGLYLGGGSPSPGFHFTKSNDLKLNDWSLVTWTYDKNTLNLFIDGVFKRSVAVSRTTDIDNSDLFLGRSYGCEPPTRYEYFLGGIDELRISTTLRSDAWIKTEYNNQSSPEDFYSVGALEDIATNLVAWVKIPELSSTADTDIYVYFGDENESNSNDTDVWDDNYVGVWHNNDYNDNSIKESKTGLANATKSGNYPPTQINGKIGYAQYFNGNKRGEITTPITNVSYTKATISFWVNFKKAAGSPGDQILGSQYWTNNNFALNQHTNNYRLLLSIGNNKYGAHYNAFSDTDTWYYYSFTYDSDQTAWADALKLYTNGVVRNISTSTGETDPLSVSSPYYLKMGKGGYFNGLLDEVRISDILRSESWIKTEYNNQSSPENFYSVGEMADANVIIDTTQTTTNASTGIYMYFGNPDANISNHNINDGNNVNIAIGVLEKS
ncbi:MAG TPA: DUF2341 domain-containing protein [archaeon]|nr:DUF2341 domain-containing protein [archaeon]